MSIQNYDFYYLKTTKKKKLLKLFLMCLANLSIKKVGFYLLFKQGKNTSIT